MLYTEEEEQQNGMSFFFLSKKTRRGRKSNFQLPEGLRCTICLEFDEFSNEPIEKCSECLSLFHPSCYQRVVKDCVDRTEADTVKSDTMKCLRCLYANRLQLSFDAIKCSICNMSSGILQPSTKDDSEDCFSHPFCKRFISELEEDDKSSLRKWRYKNSCHFCKAKLSKDQPVLKCSNSKCKEFYHIPCAIEKGMIFSIMFQANFYNVQSKRSIPFYCNCHNKRLIQKYKEYMYDWNRKSVKYTSETHDSHSDTVDDSDKKDMKKEETGKPTLIQIPFAEPKEFKMDFPMRFTDNNSLLFGNYHQYYEPIDQRVLSNNCTEDNDYLSQLMNLFQMDSFYKQIERDNERQYIN